MTRPPTSGSPASASGSLVPGEVHVVVPGDLDDPGSPSGGNTYDRQVCDALSGDGWSVRELAVPGNWPRPGTGDLDRLAAALGTVPDGGVVLLDGLVACAAPEVVVPRAERLRLVVLVHLPLADETGLAPEVAADLHARERRTLRAASAVVVTSAATGHRVRERHGPPAERVHVVPPGVRPAPLALGSDTGSRLLGVAAVTPRKGQHVLVEALAQLAGLSWSCRLVGAVDRDPDYVRRVRRLVDDRGLADRLHLTGPRTGERLAAEYAGADLLLLTSLAEPFGMVVTEALARGVPVVASEVDGLPEALGRARGGDRPGLLVPPGDPQALAAALRRWLTDPDLRDRLRTAARRRRGTLPGWDVTAARLAAVLTATARTGTTTARTGTTRARTGTGRHG